MKHIPALDGLRAIAVTLVLGSHCFPFRNGYIGVDIFFVLSGFLITSLFIAEAAATGSVSLFNFYLRRILRLAPCLILVVTATWIVARFANSPVVFHENLTDGAMALAYVSNWWQIYTAERSNVFGHTWSLSIEEQFYLLWGASFLLLCKTRSRLVIPILLTTFGLVYLWRGVLYLDGAYYWRLFHAFDTRADELLAGCIAAFAISHAGARAAIGRWLADLRLVGLGALLLLLLVCIVIAEAPALDFFVTIPLVTALSVAVILDVVLSQKGAGAAILSRPELVAVGKISYGIYLWHFPILWFVRYSPLNVASVRALLAFVLAPAIAALSYRYVEAPILSLKTRWQPRVLAAARAS